MLIVKVLRAHGRYLSLEKTMGIVQTGVHGCYFQTLQSTKLQQKGYVTLHGMCQYSDDKLAAKTDNDGRGMVGGTEEGVYSR